MTLGIMESIVMLSVRVSYKLFVLSVITLNVMLNVIMLNVVMLSVIKLNVVAPKIDH
jgi:hypothetical protein